MDISNMTTVAFNEHLERKIAVLESATEYVTKLTDIHGITEVKAPGNVFVNNGVTTVIEQIIDQSINVATWLLEDEHGSVAPL